MVVPLIVPAPGYLLAIMINNNATKTNDPFVDLMLSAQNATHLKVSNDPLLVGAVWETFVSAKQWEVKDEVVGPSYGDGPKTVYVQFGQGAVPPPVAPTQISGIYNATIILNTAPPIVGPVPIMINGGVLKTSTRQVQLILNAEGAQNVKLFNEVDLAALTGSTTLPYSSIIDWTLSEGNGIKSVFVVFVDDVGNETSYFSSSITLIGQKADSPIITEPMNGSFTTDPFIDVRGRGNPGAIVEIEIE
jgi:hypothetical protein